MLQNARVLRDEFVPSEVQHRDQEVNELSRALQPVIEGKPAETTFLFGPSGTGKTCIARHTVEKLREETLDIEHQYVNCWQNYNRASILHSVVKGLGKNPDMHRRSTPTTELLNWLKGRDGLQYIVILDEADQLEDKSILYDLYSTRGISMVLIANEEKELFGQFNERLESRFRASRRIHFDRYDLDELVSILDARAKGALPPDAISREELELIADEAAGDARVAIGILRKAAQNYDQEGHETIDREMIEENTPKAREELRQKNLDQLNTHQQVLHDIIEEHSEIEPPELYEEYRGRVTDPKTNRTVRNYLSKMEHYNLIEAKGDKRARTYEIRRYPE